MLECIINNSQRSIMLNTEQNQFSFIGNIANVICNHNKTGYPIYIAIESGLLRLRY